jgi:hypothetical protein
MSDDHRDLNPEDRVDARTSKRVAEMTDAERTALARELARRKAALHEPARPVIKRPDVRPPAPAEPTQEEEHEQAVARVTEELRKTQRHLDRLERSYAPSRYGGSGAYPGGGRYQRLLSRADRLERELRALR